VIKTANNRGDSRALGAKPPQFRASSINSTTTLGKKKVFRSAKNRHKFPPPL